MTSTSSQDTNLTSELTAILHGVLRAGRRLEWDAWFPITQAVSADPQALQDAVSALALQECYDLLDHLKADGGPLADYLLCVLASRPEVFDDDQVRAYLLADAGPALNRRASGLAGLVSQLRSNVAELDRRREDGFDLAIEVTRLEARRNELRAEQLDEEFQEMSDLEWEIARLETLRARLDDYVPAERAAHRDALLGESQRLQTDRQQTEELVAAAIRARDEALTGVERLRREAAQAEQEHGSLTDESATLSRRLDRTRGELEALQRDIVMVRGELAALEERRTALQEEFKADESRLTDLERSPVGDAARALREQIRQIYAGLPVDEMDSRFDNKRRAR
ncbi:hypothetical protein [Nocardioides sp. W7]|uniref:hypothetical protein n=1 Tax=Nocardioides sp. W7 TaxID=2931390 RepID=UPI001FD353E5|nr:hypothetical protein [Nocardioides sp. W7]